MQAPHLAEDVQTDLAQIRRLEAISFRSWPATTTRFDGTWAIRLSAGHPAKRLNSVNPLDPVDTLHFGPRLSRIQNLFNAFGRPLVFRVSPLAPQSVSDALDTEGWRRFDESLVMSVNVADLDLETVVPQLPLRDACRWIDQSIAMGGFGESERAGIAELIGMIQGKVGLFLLEDSAREPLAACMAVKFGEYFGLFEVVSHPEKRGQGFGRRVVESALLWGRKLGAQKAWLQVVANNEPACGLYQSLGFSEVYRYHYRSSSH